MKHVDTTIMLSRRCISLGRIDPELAYEVNQCKQYWKSFLQHLLSIIKFTADQGLAFRKDENVRLPRTF